MAKQRCQALDDNGVQCRREAGYEVYYHGEPGVNDKCPGWVLVRMCDQHSSSSADRRKLKDDRCAALAETPAESLEAVRAEAATSGARNLAAAFHRAVKAAAPDITYPESDEPLESAVAYIFAQIRAESKSEARREMAEIVAKLVPELRAYIRDGMAAFDTTVDDAVISALDRFRAEAGRERAVRELRIVAERWFREVAAARRLPGPFNSIGEEFGRELFARAAEIAKEGTK